MTARRRAARDCRRTDEVLAAERTGRLGDELAVHLADCASCADALLVEQVLDEDAEVAFRQAELPAVELLWLRGSLAVRRREESRALRPIAAWEGVAGLVVTGGLVLTVPGIKSWMSRWAGASWLEPILGLASSDVLPGLVVAGLAIPLLAVLGGVIWVWADG